MTPDILAGIKCRNDLFKKYRKNKNNKDGLFEQYCSVRNKVQRDIKLAKKFYFHQKIDQNRNEPKKLWAQFKSLGYSSKVTSNAETILEISGEKCFDKKWCLNVSIPFSLVLPPPWLTTSHSPRDDSPLAQQVFNNFTAIKVSGRTHFSFPQLAKGLSYHSSWG